MFRIRFPAFHPEPLTTTIGPKLDASGTIVQAVVTQVPSSLGPLRIDAYRVYGYAFYDRFERILNVLLANAVLRITGLEC